MSSEKDLSRQIFDDLASGDPEREQRAIDAVNGAIEIPFVGGGDIRSWPPVPDEPRAKQQTLTLEQVLPTRKELRRAQQLYESCPPGTFCKTVVEELIQPKLKEIEARIGQEMDPRYLGYAVEFLLSEAERQKVRF